MAEENTHRKDTLPSWDNRRKVVISTLLFCAACVFYIMIDARDIRLFETIVVSCFSLGGTVISFYIGASTWQDVSFKKTDGKK